MRNLLAVTAGLLVAASPVRSAEGELRVLTYNVAGLPAILSSSKPAVNSRLISPLLNPYDVVLLQEDFHYHADVMSAADFPYEVSPSRHGLIGYGDGMAILSRAPLSGERRVRWKRCSGYFDGKSDCLTPKGFTVAELELAPGVVVDLYDLHADAGRGRGDSAARLLEAEQLAAFIRSRPADRAVIVGGDTNMRLEDEAAFQALLQGAGLADACRALMCAEQGRFDRVLYRSGARVRLEAIAWSVPAGFVDAAGKPLSDHQPVSVRLAWTAR
jgi:endonuclease/exonuclease/phosphatase family metal-dependent hydrolase